jgi:predicted transcriptional regulator
MLTNSAVPKEYQMKLTRILEERNLSKLQLSLKAGIAPSDLYRAINGKIPFYPKWKRQVSEYLQVSQDEIFGGDPDEV